MPATVHKQIGAEKAHPDALAAMKARGGRWAAFQNHAMDSNQLGHLRFIKFGPGCTFESADALPERHPDTGDCIGWRYLLVGEVDLDTGAVKEVQS